MAKDILTIDIKDFRKQVHLVSTSQLKSLLEGLFTMIKSRAELWMKSQAGLQTIYDLERKQSIIWKELQRRKELNNKTNQEFMDWLYNKHNRRVF